MKITLRKAHALQAALNEAANKLAFTKEVALNEFEHPRSVIEAAIEKFNREEYLRKELLDTLYLLRKSVALANVAAGVNEILADVARAEKDINFYAMAEQLSPRLANEVINGKVGKLKEQPSDAGRSFHSRSDSISTNIFDKDALDQMKHALSTAKKEKVRLQDMLLEANIKNEVELTTEQVDVLHAADLL